MAKNYQLVDIFSGLFVQQYAASTTKIVFFALIKKSLDDLKCWICCNKSDNLGKNNVLVGLNCLSRKSISADAYKNIWENEKCTTQHENLVWIVSIQENEGCTTVHKTCCCFSSTTNMHFFLLKKLICKPTTTNFFWR